MCDNIIRELFDLANSFPNYSVEINPFFQFIVVKEDKNSHPRVFCNDNGNSKEIRIEDCFLSIILEYPKIFGVTENEEKVELKFYKNPFQLKRVQH